MINEETIYETNPQIEGKKEVNKDENPWKLVTLAGVTGVFMGAGLLHAGQTVAKDFSSPAEEKGSDVGSHTTDEGLKVADVEQGMSFSEAFAQARAEVGPGGVFHWHGGIYNTYTAEEWNAMSRAEKNEFAQHVRPEIRPDEVPTPTDAHPDVTVHDVHKMPEDNDVQIASDQTAETSDTDTDVHIVGYGEVQGHAAVGFDTNGDGQADVAIIDVDDSGDLSNPDVIVDNQGNMATVGDMVNEMTPDESIAASEAPEESMEDVADIPMIEV